MTSSDKISQTLRPSIQYSILILVHLACLAVYLIPILTHKHNGGAVLDEAHIMSADNKDVYGTSTLEELFTNDYWGRNMNSHSSHKSWRPLTILSFRWLKGTYFSVLTSHRIVNIFANAATGECVSILAVKLFSQLPPNHLFLLRCLVKLLFCLHPTHVEVTANAANRPHLFAVLASVVLCDPQLHILGVMVVHIIGLLCSETFIFQMPAVVITLTLIQWRNNRGDESPSSLLSSLIVLLPRHLVLFVLSVLYLIMRYLMDWLSIPEGLIRPAENPFFPFTGIHRARNYAYILVIHIFKSWNLDFIGFSHEYGFECIRELKKWTDPRFGIVLFTIGLFLYAVRRCYRNGMDDSLLLLFHLSWMATLFPISGIVKVGTFIADRIAVASTVSVCILVGRGLVEWITVRGGEGNSTSSCSTSISSKHSKMNPFKASLVLGLLGIMWVRVHNRSLEWMDSVPLLTSSLKTCPRSAKSHLEVSKIYSGLVTQLYDLDKSLYHLNKAEEIDPTYCDVHQQFAHVYIQNQRLDKFENRLAKAILCPFTMHGATEMWRRYWKVILNSEGAEEGQRRMEKYQAKIEKAVAREQEELDKGKPQWKGASLDEF